MKSFNQFVGAKVRESKRQLGLIMQVLEHGNFRVENFLEEDSHDPYLYCYNPNKDTSFKGIRIYKIGDKIAYRVQRESKTHPYGEAYMIDVDDIFNDLMDDGVTKKEKLGKELMEEIIKVISQFFKESALAEKEEDSLEDGDGLGMVHVRNPMGGDYSSMVHDPNGYGSSSGR